MINNYIYELATVLLDEHLIAPSADVVAKANKDTIRKYEEKYT